MRQAIDTVRTSVLSSGRSSRLRLRQQPGVRSAAVRARRPVRFFRCAVGGCSGGRGSRHMELFSKTGVPASPSATAIRRWRLRDCHQRRHAPACKAGSMATHNYTISRSRSLCAQSRRNRAAFEHVIATTRQVIRDSQRLIERMERARDDGLSSRGRRATSDVNTDNARKPRSTD